MKLEAVIERQILLFLRSKNIFAWKNPSAGYYDAKRKCFRKQVSEFAINGVSDIAGILPDGRALYIEVKTPDRVENVIDAKKGKILKKKIYGGKLSDTQKVFIEEALRSNALCFVARSVEEAKDGLSEYL